MVGSIILYSSTEINFETLGIGVLNDAVTCIIVEEDNGGFELELTFPITGRYYESLINRNIILAQPNPYDNPQPFRIYNISKPINGIVTVNAEHISYDLSGYPASPFSAASLQEALTKIKDSSALPMNFTFSTDQSIVKDFATVKPSSIKKLLGNEDGLLSVYGGHYKYDKFHISLNQSRGLNRNVYIRYGKNMTDLTQDENCSNVFTGVYPYWYNSSEETLIELPEKILYAEGTYNYQKIYPLDVTQSFNEEPTEEQIREVAETYMVDNKIGIPKISMTVSFIQLSNSEEYKHIALLEEVVLGDSVYVEFPELGVSSSSQVVKTTYDCIAKKYISMDLGEPTTNITDTIHQQIVDIEKTPSLSYLQQAVDNATKLVTGEYGGYVVIHSSTGAKQPNEILIMDQPKIEDAVKVWRWNQAGLGYSNTGYNGEYGLAMTMDGSIVADYITTGVLDANVLRAGIIKAANDNPSFWNLETGEMFLQTYPSKTEVDEELNSIQSLISLTAADILAQVSSVYATSDDLETTRNTILEVTDGQIDFVRETINTDISNLGDTVVENENTLREYIQFNGSQMLLGRSDNDTSLVVDNDDLAYYDGEQKGSYMTHTDVGTTNMYVSSSIYLGSVRFVVETNGSISIV